MYLSHNVVVIRAYVVPYAEGNSGNVGGLAQEIFGVQQGEGFLDDGAGEFKTGLRAMLMRRTAYN